MKKITLTSILSLCIACPAIAVDDVDIAKNTGTADCTNTVLHTTTGPTALEAAWDANTIQLKFYNDDEQFSTGECTYDGGIELPETDPTKTGYTFDGWQVRGASGGSQAPAQTTFDLSTLSEDDFSDYPTAFAGKSMTPGAYCRGFYAGEFGEDCTDSHFDLLDDGEWYDRFSSGTIKGISKCSGGVVDLSTGEVGEPASTDGANCWCKATEFDAENDGTFSSVISSQWVYGYEDFSPTECEQECAYQCAYHIQDDMGFTKAILGMPE